MVLLLLTWAKRYIGTRNLADPPAPTFKFPNNEIGEIMAAMYIGLRISKSSYLLTFKNSGTSLAFERQFLEGSKKWFLVRMYGSEKKGEPNIFYHFDSRPRFYMLNEMIKTEINGL